MIKPRKNEQQINAAVNCCCLLTVSGKIRYFPNSQMPSVGLGSSKNYTAFAGDIVSLISTTGNSVFSSLGIFAIDSSGQLDVFIQTEDSLVFDSQVKAAFARPLKKVVVKTTVNGAVKDFTQAVTICVVDDLNDLYCWGVNSSGLADPNSSESHIETSRKLLANVESVHLSNGSACAKMTDGKIRRWNHNPSQNSETFWTLTQ